MGGMNMKYRLPRKLKKAVKRCVSYYDGYYVSSPYKQRLKKGERFTKWMHRALDRYDQFYYCETEEHKETKRGSIIDRCIADCYASHSFPRWRATPKWHRLRGEIFVYSYKGVIYHKGAWVPKVQPRDLYLKAAHLKTNEFMIVHEVYSYKELKHVTIEKVIISAEEFKGKEKPLELFNKYKDRIITL
jgi:hypothetical protein